MGVQKAKPGRPRNPPTTDEQVDEATRLLGRYFYTSKVASLLQQKFKGLGRDAAYKVIDAAKARTAKELADGGNPLVEIWHGFRSLAFGDATKEPVRVQALNGMVKLVGVKALQALSEGGEIEEFVAAVRERRAARAGENAAPKGEGVQDAGRVS